MNRKDWEKKQVTDILLTMPGKVIMEYALDKFACSIRDGFCDECDMVCPEEHCNDCERPTQEDLESEKEENADLLENIKELEQRIEELETISEEKSE